MAEIPANVLEHAVDAAYRAWSDAQDAYATEAPSFAQAEAAVRAVAPMLIQAGREAAGAERDEAVDLLTDLVAKCTEYGQQDGDFVASYLLPTGPVHRAIPWLDQRGIYARPGYDPRVARGDNQEARDG